MSHEGAVMNGAIELDQPIALPDGTRVEIAVSPKKDEGSTVPVGKRLNRLAGIASDLPPDFAAEHDHYIHGKAGFHLLLK